MKWEVGWDGGKGREGRGGREGGSEEHSLKHYNWGEKGSKLVGGIMWLKETMFHREIGVC